MYKFDNSRRVSLLPGMSHEMRDVASMVSKLPGLGVNKAIAVTRHFRSPSRILSATIKEWMEVPGIGKTIANTVVDFINKEV